MNNPKDNTHTSPDTIGHAQWAEISIKVHPAAQDAVSDFLFGLGCQGVVFGETEQDFLKAYLPVPAFSQQTRNRVRTFLQNLSNIFPQGENPTVLFSTVQDENWGITWRKHFHTEQVTEKLTVVPSWEPIPQNSKIEIIRMEPGPAFGTGSHPTTRMCLEGIEAFAAPRGWSMLDVGTGSGILAIYAAKLGAARILAVDTDPEALRWAQRNIELNRPLPSIELSSKSLRQFAEKFSLLVANLTRDTLLELLPDFRRLLEKRGEAILSGLLQEQVQEVESRLARLGFGETFVAAEAEWACMRTRRKE